MIFYKNLVKSKKTKQKNLIFSIFAGGVESLDDSVAKPNSCKNFYNLSFLDGALKTGLGFSDLAVPESETDLTNVHTFDFGAKISEIIGIWNDRWFNTDDGKYRYQMLLMGADFKLWSVPLIDTYEGFVWQKSTKLVSEPTFECSYRFDNRDCSLLFSKEGMLYQSQEAQVLYKNVPAMISCVVHYDNFFGITNTNRNTLIYTKNLNILEWKDEQNSTIEFLDSKGSFTKLVAFNDYVYLFRENGITKISLYNSKNDFSFTHLYSSSSKIYENSVTVCGDKILFVTRDGLYSFNGNSVSKIADDYDKYFKNLDNTHCCSACLNGKYYLATNCDFQDGEKVGCEANSYVNNVLFEVDIDDYSLNLYRGVDVRKLLSVDNPFMSKLCACFYNDNKTKIGQLEQNGKTFSNINSKLWASHKTDLGQAGLKRLKEVSLISLYPCSLTIKSDEEEKTFNFDGSDKNQRKRLNIRGKHFQFIFKTDEVDCDIKKPMIVYDCL